MPRAIRIHETGGPEVMRLEEVEVPAPAAGERAGGAHRHRAQLHRRLRSLGPVCRRTLPAGLGREAAGIVSAVGTRVRGFRVGDRVAYVLSTSGHVLRPAQRAADRLVKIPAGVSDEQAAVLMLKGMTACYLLRHTYRVKRGDVIVVHAAAGGVGLLLSQWGKALGAIVIGIVGSEEKAKLAKKNGCKHVLVRGRDEIAATVKKLSKGLGAHVVYDAVGKDTFIESLDCLRKRGLLVSLRQRFRARAAVLRGRAREARFAVRDAADAVRLHRGSRAISSRWRARPSRW